MRDVIVIGMNYSITLGIIRSLGEAGYGVRLLAFEMGGAGIVAASKYVKQCVRIVEFELDKILEGLEKLRGDEEKILVIPLNDRCCRLIDEHYDLFADHFYIPNIDNQKGAVSAYMDKMKQKKLARENGLLTARGRAYSTESIGIEEAQKEMSYPCFLKPLASADIQNCKTAFAICSNRDELSCAMETLRGRGADAVLIEEYLNITQELCLYGVAGDGEAYAPVLVETLRGGFFEHRGVAAEGIAVSGDKLGEIREKVENLIKSIHYTGMFCVDLFNCDSLIYFSEINLRAGGSGYAATLAGVNLPGLLADIVYQQAISRPKEVRREVRFLNERIEFDAYIRGFISRRDYKAHLAEHTERFIWCEDDPGPWRHFQKMVLRVSARAKMRSLAPEPAVKIVRKIKQRRH